jgi:hypothetical protein
VFYGMLHWDGFIGRRPLAEIYLEHAICYVIKSCLYEVAHLMSTRETDYEVLGDADLLL